MALKQAVPAESLVAANSSTAIALGAGGACSPHQCKKNPFSKAIEPNLLDEVRNEAFHEAY
jgi:hypothetical protein